MQKLDRLQLALGNAFKEQLRQSKEDELLLKHRLRSIDLIGKVTTYQENLKHLTYQLEAHTKHKYEKQFARFEKAQDALLSLDTTRIIAGICLGKKRKSSPESVKTLKKEINLALKCEMVR